MLNQELNVLEEYCVENGWDLESLQQVMVDSLEPEDLYRNNGSLPNDVPSVLGRLLDEFGTVDRVLALLPGIGED